jgi:hypothetical protein
VCSRRGAVRGNVRLSVEEERRMENGRGAGVSVWVFFEVRVGGFGREGTQIGRGSLRARQLAVSLDVHWPVRAAHRTGGIHNQKGRGCASFSTVMGLRLWREGRRGGGRSARGEDAQLMHARCSMDCCLPDHRREGARETGQSRWRAW